MTTASTCLRRRRRGRFINFSAAPRMRKLASSISLTDNASIHSACLSTDCHDRNAALTNLSPTSTGTAELTAYSAASSMSDWKPRSTSSWPEVQRVNAPGKSSPNRSKAATASSASGDLLPGSIDNMAPAPIQSSRQGRKDSSGHRSPAGMTATRLADCRRCAAIAVAFRRHPA